MQIALAPILALISIALNASTPYCIDRVHNVTWVLDEPLEGVVTGYRPLIVADIPDDSWAIVVSPYSNHTLQLSMEKRSTSNTAVLMSPIPVPLTANVTVYLIYENDSMQCSITILYYAEKIGKDSVEIRVPEPKHYDPLRIINESLKKLGGGGTNAQGQLSGNSTSYSNVSKRVEEQAVLSGLSSQVYFAILAVAVLVLVVDYLSSPRRVS